MNTYWLEVEGNKIVLLDLVATFVGRKWLNFQPFGTL